MDRDERCLRLLSRRSASESLEPDDDDGERRRRRDDDDFLWRRCRSSAESSSSLSSRRLRDDRDDLWWREDDDFFLLPLGRGGRKRGGRQLSRLDRDAKQGACGRRDALVRGPLGRRRPDGKVHRVALLAAAGGRERCGQEWPSASLQKATGRGKREGDALGQVVAASRLRPTETPFPAASALVPAALVATALVATSLVATSPATVPAAAAGRAVAHRRRRHLALPAALGVVPALLAVRRVAAAEATALVALALVGRRRPVAVASSSSAATSLVRGRRPALARRLVARPLVAPARVVAAVAVVTAVAVVVPPAASVVAVVGGPPPELLAEVVLASLAGVALVVVVVGRQVAGRGRGAGREVVGGRDEALARGVDRHGLWLGGERGYG